MKKSLLCVLSVLILLLVLVPPSPAQAASTWTVDSSADGPANSGHCSGGTGTCTLRDAISASSTGDLIQFDPLVTGTITLSNGQMEIVHDLTITGPGSGTLTIDAHHASRIFQVDGSTSVSISGLTLTNGQADDNIYTSGANFQGGAILNFGSLTLDGMVVSNSVATCFAVLCSNWGGGIRSWSASSLTITNSTLTGNSVMADGGAIYFDASGGSLILTNVNFAGNEAVGKSTSDGACVDIVHTSGATFTDVTFTSSIANKFGGAIYLENGPLTITDGTFGANVSNNSRGGAIYVDAGGTLTVHSSSFSLNHNMLDGGAIYLTTTHASSIDNTTFTSNYVTAVGGAIASVNTPLTVSSSTFAGNSASSSGGAVYLQGGTVTIVNSTFTGNGSSTNGGGIYEGMGSNLTVDNSTLSGNGAAGSGGGLYNDSATLTLQNTILAHSLNGGDCVSWSPLSLDTNNLIEANDVTHPCGVPLSTADPVLGALASNGGSTQTMALLAGSAAIEAGDNTVCANAPVSAVDQRGTTRPQGPHCDIGAYEYVHTFADVPVSGKEWMEWWIEAFYNAGITTGCGANPLIYCPESSTTRAAMAVFILRAVHGVNYTPPAATGIFSDVPVAGKEWMQPWIEEFYNEGITTGCGTGPLIFCPEAPVTRAAMAVFLLRAIHGSGYAPPASSGIFSDVPVVGKEWMQPWIEEFYNEGITTGCGTNPLIYCPETATTRAAMAVFIDRAFGLYP